MTAELLPAEWHVQVNNARRQQGLRHLASLLRGATQELRTRMPGRAR